MRLFLVNGAKGLETQVGCDLELCTLVLFEDKPNNQITKQTPNSLSIAPVTLTTS